MVVSSIADSNDCQTYATWLAEGAALGAVLNTRDKSIQPPSVVESVTGEVEIGYWEPQTIAEWTAVQETTAFVKAWIQQQEHERSLRKMIGIWVFILITLQIMSVIALVALDAGKMLAMNVTVVKFLIPSVLSEVFGMGFVVVKYLFKPPSNNPLDFGKPKG